MRRVVLEQKLGFVATVCPDGTPNLSPKGTTTVWDDDHLPFADIRSPQTLRNLTTRPVAEINVVDPIVRKGYRFKGQATLHSDDEIYERGLALLAERGYDARPERVRTIVLVKIEQAAPLVSPAYDGGAAEEIVAARWERHLAAPRSEPRDPTLAAPPTIERAICHSDSRASIPLNCAEREAPEQKRM